MDRSKIPSRLERLLLEGRQIAAADLREARVELGQFVGMLVDDLQHLVDVVRRTFIPTSKPQ